MGRRRPATVAVRHPPAGAGVPPSVGGSSGSGSAPGTVAGSGSASGPSSITLVPLLLPRVAAVVVAVLLPEARLVPLHHGDPADPLGALPEVQVRHQHPH